MGSALPRVASCPQTPFHVNSLQEPLHLRMAVLFQPPPPPRLPQVPRPELGVRTGWFPAIPARLGAEAPAGHLPVPLLRPCCSGRCAADDRCRQKGGSSCSLVTATTASTSHAHSSQPMAACQPVLLAGHVSRAHTGHSPAVCGRWAWAGGGPEQVFIGLIGAEYVWALISSLDRNWRMVFNDSLLHLETL